MNKITLLNTKTGKPVKGIFFDENGNAYKLSKGQLAKYEYNPDICKIIFDNSGCQYDNPWADGYRKGKSCRDCRNPEYGRCDFYGCYGKAEGKKDRDRIACIYNENDGYKLAEEERRTALYHQLYGDR